MKTLHTLVTAALFASAAITVQADNSLSNLIYEESSDIYAEASAQSSTPVGILSYGDDGNKSSVWSTEFEQYVDPAVFQQVEISSVDNINQHIGGNPTAAGSSREVFIYNELAGEYQLQ